MTPMISVLMSTFNTPEAWLEESISSILNQTYEDFEFLIVDDCSTVNMEGVKKRFTDPRIQWIRNEENMGLTKSLNKMLKMAKGKYIARMDADDVALPERFETQIAYMESHPKVIVAGSWRKAIGNETKNEIWNIPEERARQQVELFFYNCGLTHPTAMFRKSMLDEFGICYNENYKKAQDYGIWVQCTRYAPMAMIHNVLLLYRKSNQQITNDKNGVSIYDSMVKTDQLYALGLTPTDEEKDMHIAFCSNKQWDDPDEIYSWNQRLLIGNYQTHYFDEKLFRIVLHVKLVDYCRWQYKVNHIDSYKPLYRKVRNIGDMMKNAELSIKQLIAKRLGR